MNINRFPNIELYLHFLNKTHLVSKYFSFSLTCYDCTEEVLDCCSEMRLTRCYIVCGKSLTGLGSVL